MFDHGADIINTVLLAISLCAVTGIGQTWLFPLLFVGLSCGFFFNTLEEYYTGRLDLPIINGVSDGCVLIYAIGIITGIYGVHIWQIEIFLGLSLVEIVLYGFTAGAILTVIMK